MQKAPSELACSLSAPCTQSVLSQKLIWLFCSNGTGNPSILCPIGCLDSISKQSIEPTPPGHIHIPCEKVIKAEILLCSHQQQNSIFTRRIMKITFLATECMHGRGRATCYHCRQEEPSHQEPLQFVKHAMFTMPSLPIYFFTSLPSSAK